MEKTTIIDILSKLLPKFANLDIALIGTANLYLQGIEVSPRDLDFITNDECLIKISKEFESEVKKDSEFGYLETEFIYLGEEIHIASWKNNPLRAIDIKDIIELEISEMLKFPALSLESEYGAYKKMGREKDLLKIKLISEKLNS